MISDYFVRNEKNLQILKLNVATTNIIVKTNSQLSLDYFSENIVISGVNGINFGFNEKFNSEMTIYCYIKPIKDFIQLEGWIKNEGDYIGDCRQQHNGYYVKYRYNNDIVYVSPSDDVGATQNIICKKNSTLLILSSGGKYDYKLLTRILREIAYRKLEDDGYIAIHGSAIQLNGKGVLIIGDSAVGKTTLALSMCKNKGAAYLCNDKVLVKKSANHKLFATGFSSSARLNYGTLIELGLDCEYATWQLKNDKPDAKSDWKQFNGKKKLDLLPSELNKFLGISIINTMEVEKIIFPKINFNLENTIVLNKPNTETINFNIRTPNDDIFPEDWLLLRNNNMDWLVNMASEIAKDLGNTKSMQLEYSFRDYSNVLNLIERYIVS